MVAHAPARTGDAIAIGLSGLCLAHCLVLPLAPGFLPLLGAWAGAEWVHWAFVATAAPVSLWTLGRRQGKVSAATVGLAVVGVALLVAGAAGYPDHDLETSLTVIGGLSLAVAHLINWRRRALHGAPARRRISP
ncbi:MAG: MerC domain-containing protein [Brevundimonas sp.]|nr:MerC domain-containing protein [Brevundimonas sp.]